MRVGIVGLLHESNTFVGFSTTTLESFQRDIFAIGEDVRKRFYGAPHEIGGFFAGLTESEIEAVPIFAARATPYGPIAHEAFGQILRTLFESLNRAGELDGILIAAHGTAVCDSSRQDADGYWLSTLREKVGPRMPLVATLDLHANLSRKMVNATTALIGYRTNPHIDQRERGIEAARLMARTLRGEVKPTMAAAFPPVAINIERQLTSEPPCSQLYSLADEMLGEPMVLSNSILLGFPYADVPEMGSSVVVVTDNEPELAQQLADGLAHEIVQNREQFRGHFLSIDEALDQAMKLDGPVCLLDMGDNIGGGGLGDSTALAWALHAASSPPAFICVDNLVAVQESLRVGLGGRIEMAFLDRYSEHPWPWPNCEVLSLHDGKFTETGTTHGGITQFDQGPTAIVRTDHGLTIMLTSQRTPPFSLRQLTAFDINPSDYHIIVAKGVHAPRAAYAPVCKHFLRVDTPGVTRADMTKLEYRHRRRQLFPFEDVG